MFFLKKCCIDMHFFLFPRCELNSGQLLYDDSLPAKKPMWTNHNQFPVYTWMVLIFDIGNLKHLLASQYNEVSRFF